MVQFLETLMVAALARRAFVRSLAIGMLALPMAATLSPATAQESETVDVAKLMAEQPLEDIVIGNTEAKITIVEYASMTCGHCGRFHNDVYPQLKAKYIDTGKVKLVFREFPLDNLAAAASMLCRCTGSTDSAAKLAGVLFKKQRDWVVREPVPKLFEIVKQAGFTQEKFNACLQDQELLNKIAAQRERASGEFDVNSTPTFFINGKRLQGRSDQLSTFEEILDPLIANDGA